MSETSSNDTQTGTQDSRVPRAIIHKRILDVAEDRPDASMASIAADVSGATVDIVEQVLEEYGDPATDAAESEATEEPDANSSSSETAPSPLSTETAGSADTEGAAPVDGADESSSAAATADTEPVTSDGDPDASVPPATASASGDSGADATDTAASKPAASGDRTAWEGTDSQDGAATTVPSLTLKQRATLRAIARTPDATQAEIADRLGVTPPTVSQRINSIDGYEWATRHNLIQTLKARDILEPAGDAPLEPAHTSDASADRTSDSMAMTNRDHEGTDADEQTHDRRDAETTDQSAPEEDTDRIEALETRVATLADRLETLEQRVDTTGAGGLPVEPELAHKLIHASMSSDRITEDEELQLIQAVLADGPNA